MIATLEALLLESWDELGCGRPRPGRIHVAKLSHEEYPPVVSPLLFLLFPDRESRPVAVAKVARVAAGDAHVEKEARAIDGVRRVLPAALRDQVPRPIRSGVANGRTYLLETALAGQVELHHTWGVRAARRCLPRIGAALEWIERVAAATSMGSVRASDWLGRSPDEIRGGLARLGCPAPTLTGFATRLPDIAALEWPGALAHGDYFPGNVLFGRGASRTGGWRDIAVVDWMLAEASAPAFVDALTYELSFSTQALHAGRQPSPEEIRAVHALPPFAAVRQAWRQRGVDLGLGSPARLATLAHAALRDGDPAGGRGPIGATWARLLDLEIESFPPPREDASS